MKKILGIIVGALLACTSFAEVKVELLKDGKFKVDWNGKEIVKPSRPEVDKAVFGKNRKRTAKIFDPTANTEREVNLSESNLPKLVIFNDVNQRLLLGDGKELKVEKTVNGVKYLKEYPESETSWAINIESSGEDSFDVTLDIQTSPANRLVNFGLNLFNLNLNNASGDSGDIGHRQKNLEISKWFGAIKNLWIGYPAGKYGYVPAGVLQDKDTAMGVCLLDTHKGFHPCYVSMRVQPPRNQQTPYNVSVTGDWDGLRQLSDYYIQKYHKRFRFKFSKPKKVGEAGYLRLVDAKDLWIDYMDELNKYVPVDPNPKYNPKKYILMNMFPCLMDRYATPENPQGWTFNAPNGFPQERWKWGYRKDGRPADGGAEYWRKKGYKWENRGKPVNWIKDYARNMVKTMREGNCQSTIVWNTARSKFSQVNYISESHFFHPDLEELIPVKGKVRNWDWLTADISVLSEDGKIIAEQPDTLIHAADTENLIVMSVHNKNLQKLKIKTDSIKKDGALYKDKAKISWIERNVNKNSLIVELLKPKHALLGLKIGDSAELEATPLLDDRALAAKNVKIKVTIKEIKRSAIDVWAKTLADANLEFGFLVRESFTYGLPWKQSTADFDWTSEWQYKMLKQRFQWHRERFGPKCRWFYLDVFATRTPAFILKRLRYDFPSMLFFAEHEKDIVDRTIASGRHFMPSELEIYVAPKLLSYIRPFKIMKGDLEKDKETMAPYLNSPHCLLLIGGHEIPKIEKIKEILKKEGRLK
jgi:hypothetical protein